jgi:diaminopimelate decarboxylase
VIDEEGFRRNCRRFKEAFSSWGDVLVAYAGKSLSNVAICKIVAQEGLGLDVVSGGELYTALQAEFPPERIIFHGNNKDQEEIRMALQVGVGRIVVDNFHELDLLNSIAAEMRCRADIMLRVTPGVEAHTHEYIQTGQIDTKFGFTLPDGQALEGVGAALNSPNLNLTGLHCHIGSQIFDMDSFRHATNLMMEFTAQIQEKTGHEMADLDIGGGFGIYYAEGDKPTYPEEWAEAVMTTVQEKARLYGLRVPRVIIEPGRAISGPAGITLYTVGSFKEVTGVRKYVAVDGGMADNIRLALYNAEYSALLANKADQPPAEIVSVAGKCCESGDMLIWDIELPQVEPGDILAVFATGAYNYAMSSNYNRLPRPAMVLVNQGSADLILKRETYADIIRNDMVPERLMNE